MVQYHFLKMTSTFFQNAFFNHIIAATMSDHALPANYLIVNSIMQGSDNKHYVIIVNTWCLKPWNSTQNLENAVSEDQINIWQFMWGGGQ